ncbi:Translation initiation factor 4E [Monocercomonoides exilis]|uniref:Translation initiation factor 4E n=1 Tax=Monocercomonoides exilis TaxID=2049356 RepID=UPI003559FD8E|nr:Translation initiation factor 4E [Monocercomonoides exilis]
MIHDKKEHPLHFEWTFFYRHPVKKAPTEKEWMASFYRLKTFSTVEGFWEIICNVPQSSILPQKAAYYLFRSEISPAWEDPENINGETLSLTIRTINSQAILEHVYLEILMLTIGDLLPEPEKISGVVYTASKLTIELWLKQNTDREKLQSVLTEVVSKSLPERNRSNISKTIAFAYTSHSK